MSDTPQPTTTDPLKANDPAFMQVFDEQYVRVWSGGVIPAKYKELTGIALSLMGRCEPCLRYHVRMAVEAGATRGEIVEMVRLSILSAGSITIPLARVTYALLDEFATQMAR